MGCSHCEPEPDYPIVGLTTAYRDGGCSFCNRHTSARGESDHRVTIVRGPNLIVRFCDRCLSRMSSFAIALKGRA